MSDQSPVTAKVGKWGNALGIHLPKSICSQMGLKVGDSVTLSVNGDNRLVVEPEDRTLKGRMRDWDGTRYVPEDGS